MLASDPARRSAAAEVEELAICDAEVKVVWSVAPAEVEELPRGDADVKAVWGVALAVLDEETGVVVLEEGEEEEKGGEGEEEEEEEDEDEVPEVFGGLDVAGSEMVENTTLPPSSWDWEEVAILVPVVVMKGVRDIEEVVGRKLDGVEEDREIVVLDRLVEEVGWAGEESKGAKEPEVVEEREDVKSSLPGTYVTVIKCGLDNRLELTVLLLLLLLVTKVVEALLEVNCLQAIFFRGPASAAVSNQA